MNTVYHGVSSADIFISITEKCTQAYYHTAIQHTKEMRFRTRTNRCWLSPFVIDCTEGVRISNSLQ